MKKMLFIFFLMVISLTEVKAQVFYFGHGPYQTTNEYIEETLTLEVIQEGDIYKYRSRNYVDIPGYIKVNSHDFVFKDVIKSNLSLEELNFNTTCDFSQNKDCLIGLKYGTFGSSVLVTINIPENDLYINIPSEIIVTDYSFDILEYVDTNITDPLEIVGDINLYENGLYNVIIKYKTKSVETTIKVDNPDNIKEEPRAPEVTLEKPQKVENVSQNVQTYIEEKSKDIQEENIEIDEVEKTIVEEDDINEEKDDQQQVVDEEEKQHPKKKVNLLKFVLVIVLIMIIAALSNFVYRIK